MKVTKQGIESVRDVLVIVGLAFGGFQLWQVEESLELAQAGLEEMKRSHEVSATALLFGPYWNARTEWLKAMREEMPEEDIINITRHYTVVFEEMCAFANKDMLSVSSYNRIVEDAIAMRGYLSGRKSVEYTLTNIKSCPTKYKS